MGGGGALLLYLSKFFVYCRGLEPGAFKMEKISLNKLKLSRRFDPVSFRVNVLHHGGIILWSGKGG